MTLDKIAALRRIKLFAELDENTLRVLAERAFERRFQKDEVLFVAGEEAHGLYVIVAGAVRAFRVSLDGREQVIHVERAGATIAEVPVFDDGTYPSTAAAEEDTTVLFIDKRDVLLNVDFLAVIQDQVRRQDRDLPVDSGFVRLTCLLQGIAARLYP